jgi:hypothetical protein
MRVPEEHHSHILISYNQQGQLWTTFWEPWKYKRNQINYHHVLWI